MSFKTFMNSIGNAFKTGWQNGNIQKGISATGTLAMGVGMTGLMMKSLKNDSIFGNGCCNRHCGNNFNMYNTNNMFGFGGSNWFNNNNTNLFGNNYNMSYNNQQYSFLSGYQLGLQSSQTTPAYLNFSNLLKNKTTSSYTFELDKELDKLNYTHGTASNIEDSVTTQKGKDFDKATDNMSNEDLNDDNVKQIKFANLQDNETKKTDYLKGLKETAQSYVKYLSDGKQTVSEDTFVEKEVAKAIKENSNTDRKDAILKATNYFRQIDLDGDGEIDWQEMASTISSMDAGGEANGKKDGKISKDEYANAFTVLNNGQFGAVNWTTYRKLFGDD